MNSAWSAKLFGFSLMTSSGRAGFSIQAIPPLRGHGGDHLIEVVLQLGERQCMGYPVGRHRPRLAAQRAAVVDDIMRIQVPAPFHGLGPGRGRDHAQPRELAGQLDGDRADPAGPAENEQSALRLRPDPKPIEEHLPGGDGGERERSRLGKPDRRRLPAD